jgi:hypothetical protein
MNYTRFRAKMKQVKLDTVSSKMVARSTIQQRTKEDA